MKIQLNQIELSTKVKALGSRDRAIVGRGLKDLYYDTELGCFFATLIDSSVGHKFTGNMLIPASSVAAAEVASESIPEHQPVGTPATHDTPSGTRKKRTVEGGKETIAERIEARAASKKSEG